MRKPHDTDELMYVEEAAALARTSPSTIRYWLRAGRVRSVRPGRRRLVIRSSLLAFLGLAEAEPSPAPAPNARVDLPSALRIVKASIGALPIRWREGNGGDLEHVLDLASSKATRGEDRASIAQARGYLASLGLIKDVEPITIKSRQKRGGR